MKTCANVPCSNEFKPSSKTQKYCSRSCAVTVNNLGQRRNWNSKSINLDKKCTTCLGPVSSTRTLNCNKCKSTTLKLWLNGLHTGAMKSGEIAKSVREYIWCYYKYSCVICGWDERHPVDNRPLVQLEHLNGNPYDHNFDNLTVLCPNHHAMTDTYGNRNRGNGRTNRHKPL